jgi:predicted kinase
MANLLMVCGLPGSGKSTVANKLKKELDISYFSTDLIRESLGFTNYLPKKSTYVAEFFYKSLIESLVFGNNTIIESPYHLFKNREYAYQISEITNSNLTILEVVCDEKLGIERVLAREKIAGKYTPTSSPEVREKYKSFWEDISEDLPKLASLNPSYFKITNNDSLVTNSLIIDPYNLVFLENMIMALDK